MIPNRHLLSAALAVAFASVPLAAQAQAQTAPASPPPARAATQDQAAGKLNAADARALREMQQANMAEVATGKLALEKSQSSDVKAFAQKMVDDHSAAMKDVATVAQQKGVELPTEPDSKHKKAAEKLSRLNAGEFDKQYMAKAGVEDHRMVESKLKKVQSSAKDPDVSALAGKMLPVVHSHLMSAQQMAK
jgi:putative membrane protein